MKKVLAIFLLLQIGSSNTFAENLLRVPALFRHFNHHSLKHHDVTGFTDFLHKHYSDHHAGEGKENHPDDDNDCELPFNHCNSCCLSTHNTFTGALTAFNLLDQGTSVAVHHAIEDENIRSLHLCNIWQPPRSV